MSVAAVVLAAGASSRLGQPKQLLVDMYGEVLVHKVAGDAFGAGCQPVCVIVGANASKVRAAVADLEVLVVENPHWSEGLSTSIRCGVAAVVKSGCEGVLLLTCDMPSVGSAHIQLLMNEFNGASPHVASSYGDTWGIPAIFPAADFMALEALQGDKGAKAILMARNALLIPLAGGTFDLDTPEDVANWRSASWR